MPKVALYNMQGETVGDIELSDAVFAAEVNEALLHQAVVAYWANQRVGTASTRTRGEVRGGGRKPWRQKGTGRARHGSIRSPLWRGGGITFGPVPRDYEIRLPRKARREALKSALSARLREGDLLVLDELSFPRPRTKDLLQVLKNLKVDRTALIITGGENGNVVKSARNLEGITTAPADSINVYDVLVHDVLIFTRDAVARVEEALA